MEKKREYTRVGEVDLFRLVFSVIIMFRHAERLLGKNLVFPGGAFGVEFFFIVSGYLMMASMEKYRDRKIENVGKETFLFLKKKVAGVYPEVVLSFVIGFLVQCIFRKLPWEKIEQLLMNSFFEVLLLQRAGVGENSVNAAIWYIQSMLLCMAVLYPLLRKYPEIMRWIVMPLTTLFLLGYLETNYNSLRDPSKWLGFTYKGNIRAMAELCLGAESYYAVRWLRQFHLTHMAKVLLTTVKWCCWAVLCAYTWVMEWRQDVFMVTIFTVAIVLSFSCQCVDIGLFQNNLVNFLGKFSLSVYLCHYFYARYLPYVLPEGMRYRYMLLCYVVCSLVTALVVMYLAGVIRKNLPSIKASLRRCFLAQ